MKRMALLAVSLTVSLCVSPHRAEPAGKYDGSTPLLCVPTLITECGPDGACERRTAEAVNLPQFLKVDLGAMKVHSEETGRLSPVHRVEHTDGSLIVQGGQTGRAWSLTIAEDTGKLLATISAEGAGFVIFGACTPL